MTMQDSNHYIKFYKSRLKLKQYVKLKDVLLEGIRVEEEAIRKHDRMMRKQNIKKVEVTDFGEIVKENLL